MNPSLSRLGAFCARRRLPVIGAWLLGVVALAIVLSSLGGTRTDDDVSLPGADSQRAADTLKADFPEAANGAIPISFVAPPGQQLTRPDYEEAVAATVSAYRHDPRVYSATGPFEPAGVAQLSQDGTVGYIALQLKDGSGQLSEADAEALIAKSRPLAGAGLDPEAGGYLGKKVFDPDIHISEVVGLLAAVLILLVTFGTAVAMGLPILTAISGLVGGLSIVGLLSQVVGVPSTAASLATMIGLGVGIDYSLFVITRHRQQLAAGVGVAESIARATASSGGAVVFAGGTVIVALLSLALAGIPIVTTLGYTAAIVVAVAVLAALTLLPALLALVGRRIDSLRVPGLRHEHDHRPHGWARWARLVSAHPWPAVAVSLVVVAVLAFPALHLSLGQSDTGALPDNATVQRSYHQMERGFGPGSNGPVLVTVDLGGEPAGPGDPRLASLGEALSRTPGVAAVGKPLVDAAGDAAVFSVQPTTAPSDPATSDLVHRLRDEVIPAATAGGTTRADVGGITAGYVDLADAISRKLPLVIGVVLLLSFVLLLLAFRSILVPLKAVVMNLLSIGAAFGVVTFFFDHDWTARLLGLPGSEAIVSYVPLMMFAILFGLSMDYEVFLMTHIRERFLTSGEHREAVVEGVAETARVITAAALIMVSVFCAFLLSGDPTIKQFGLGMAVAVAVDATVIRCLLVPAVMSLLGRAAWWMPTWLDRATPRIAIEGEQTPLTPVHRDHASGGI